MSTAPISVVIATQDRRRKLLHTVEQLEALPERPPVIVVDNGSQDGSGAAVRAQHARADVVTLGRNLGAAARNIGVRRAATPYVAFADDDSWWAPGALSLAATAFDAHERLGLIAARVLVGPESRLDPTSAVMGDSPLPPDGRGPGQPVLGFLACGAVVRREAFLEVGGFDDLLFFLGEETLVAMDLTAAGWGVHYLDEVIAHHHPTAPGEGSGRRRRQLRNELLTTWMRRPPGIAIRATARVARGALRDPACRGALVEATKRVGPVVRRRRRLPSDVEAHLRQLG
ncbi:MAG: glycosyltransferase [Acidimicrobiales bacterium]